MPLIYMLSCYQIHLATIHALLSTNSPYYNSCHPINQFTLLQFMPILSTNSPTTIHALPSTNSPCYNSCPPIPSYQPIHPSAIRILLLSLQFNLLQFVFLHPLISVSFRPCKTLVSNKASYPTIISIHTIPNSYPRTFYTRLSSHKR